MKTGEKWQVEEVVQHPESRLVKAVTKGRARLGSFPTSSIINTRHVLGTNLKVQEGVMAVEKERTCRVVAMKQQWAWPRWKNTDGDLGKITWV